MRVIFEAGDKSEVKSLFCHLQKCGIDFIVVENDALQEHRRMCDDALEYVTAIDEYATEVWRPQLRQLWQAVVCDEIFTNVLVMKKGRQRGQLNRYVMTAIVFYLQALDIYQNVNQIELHRRLENVTDRNSIYKSACKYNLSTEQKRRIRELKVFHASRK